MSVRKLVWLASRLLGYRRRVRRPCPEPDGTVLEEREMRPRPSHQGCTVRRLRYAHAGAAVVGYSLDPPGGVDATTPVLLYYRGGLGPHGLVEDEDFELLSTLATQGGFLVLATQYRGNDGGDGDDRAGLKEARDGVLLLEYARARLGAAEPRVVTLGFSRGASMSLMAHRDGLRPRAMATIGGVSDLAGAFAAGDWLLRSAIRISTGGRPGARTAPEYLRRSPAVWAEDLAAPLLLLHGEADGVIPLGQSLAFAARLAALGKPHRLVTFAGGDHKLLSHGLERVTQLLAFYREHLG